MPSQKCHPKNGVSMIQCFFDIICIFYEQKLETQKKNVFEILSGLKFLFWSGLKIIKSEMKLSIKFWIFKTKNWSNFGILFVFDTNCFYLYDSSTIFASQCWAQIKTQWLRIYNYHLISRCFFIDFTHQLNDFIHFSSLNKTFSGRKFYKRKKNSWIRKCIDIGNSTKAFVYLSFFVYLRMFVCLNLTSFNGVYVNEYVR